MRSKQPTKTSLIEASPCATSPPPQGRKSRFLLRADRGFLAASHSLEGPPITVVPTPETATTFVDWITAVRRAQALQLLGWRNLRVVEHRLPLS